MKKIVVLTILLFSFNLLLSCYNNPSMGIERANIIGKTTNNLPYGYGYKHFGWKNINGKRNRAIAVYYKNDILVYIINDGVVNDYFFSKVINVNKAKKIPIGSTYEELIKKIGEPAFLIYDSDYREDIDFGSENDNFESTYIQKQKETLFSPYEISPFFVHFLFNSNGELIDTYVKYGAH